MQIYKKKLIYMIKPYKKFSFKEYGKKYSKYQKANQMPHYCLTNGFQDKGLNP